MSHKFFKIFAFFIRRQFGEIQRRATQRFLRRLARRCRSARREVEGIPIASAETGFAIVNSKTIREAIGTSDGRFHDTLHDAARREQRTAEWFLKRNPQMELRMHRAGGVGHEIGLSRWNFGSQKRAAANHQRGSICLEKHRNVGIESALLEMVPDPLVDEICEEHGLLRWVSWNN